MDLDGQTVRSRAVEENDLGGVLIRELPGKTKQLGATHSPVHPVSNYDDERCKMNFPVRYNKVCIVLYCIVLYCIVLYCIVLYCIVLYCIVL